MTTPVQAQVRRQAQRAMAGQRDYGLQPHSLYGDTPQAIGGDYIPELIDSLNTNLQNEQALLQEVVNQTRYMAMALQANSRYLGGSGAPSGPLQGVFGNGAYENHIVKATARRTAADQSAARNTSEAPAPRQRDPYEEASPSRHRQHREEVPDAVSPWATSLRNANQGYSIQQRIAQSLAQRMSDANYGPNLAQHADGKFYHASGPKMGSQATADEVASFAGRARLFRGAQNFLGSVAEGETVGGAAQGALGGIGLGSVAAGLGYAGAAYVAANQVKNFVNNQRNENASFQRVLGGTNAEGFGERMQQRLFGIQQGWFGGMGGGAAEQLYQGAASIYGRDTAGRQAAEDFGTTAWRKWGMEVSQSLELVKTAAESGNVTLAGLADSLDKVTEAARNAGVNADSARQVFTRQYASAGATMEGPAVASVQGALATAQANLGRQFQGIDLSKLNSQQTLSIMAAQSGMDYGPFVAKMGSDSVFAGKAVTNYLRGPSVLGSLTASPGAVDFVNKFVADKTANGDQMSEADWRELSNQLVKNKFIDPRTATALLNSTVGSGFTDTTSVQFLAHQMVDKQGGSAGGTFDIGQQMIDAQSASQPQALTDEQKKQWGKYADSADHTATSDSAPNDPVLKDIIKTITGGDNNPTTDTQQDYIDMVKRTGVRNPIIEKMLGSGGFGDSTRFRVKTADGDRYVTEDQLVRDYAGQAATAEIVKGPNSGMRVGEAVGIDASTLDQLDTSGSTTAGAKSGDKTAPKRDDQKGDANSGTRGTIEIVPSDKLMPWLRFLDQNGQPYPINTSGNQPLPPASQSKSGN